MARKKTGLSVHRTIMIMGSGFISIIALLFIGCAVQRDSSLRLDPCYVIQQTLSNREFLKESSLKIFGIDSIIIIDRKDFLRLCKLNNSENFRTRFIKYNNYNVDSIILHHPTSIKNYGLVVLDNIHVSGNIVEMYFSAPVSNHAAYFKYKQTKASYELLDYSIGQY